MPRKKVSPPVSSFGPELLVALLKGGESRLEVRLPSFDAAFALRQRLYALRRAMRLENHAQASIAYRCSIANPSHESDGTSILILRPHDELFSTALRSAGVELKDLDSKPLDEVPESDSPLSESVLKHILADL